MTGCGCSIVRANVGWWLLAESMTCPGTSILRHSGGYELARTSADERRSRRGTAVRTVSGRRWATSRTTPGTRIRENATHAQRTALNRLGEAGFVANATLPDGRASFTTAKLCPRQDSAASSASPASGPAAAAQTRGPRPEAPCRSRSGIASMSETTDPTSADPTPSPAA